MLPKIIKNYDLFIDGIGYAGLAEEVVLPALERKTENWRGAGMLGEVEVDLGMEALKLEMTLAEFHDDVIKKFALGDASGINARLMSAAKADRADSKTDAIEISARGRFKKIDLGTVKAGDLAKMKVEMPLTYYKYSVNAEALVEIDLINGTEVINGEDRSRDILAAIGMNS